MKTIIATALGFMAARQIYIKYDKQQALEKEAQFKKRLMAFLEDNGLSKSEVKEQTKEIMGV